MPIYYEIEYKTKKNKTILVGLNAYRNMHFHLNNKIKTHYHELIGKMTHGKVLETPCISKNILYLMRKGTDGHNVAPIIQKYVYDALQEHGVIAEDNTDHILGDQTEYRIDKKRPRMEITLISKQK